MEVVEVGLVCGTGRPKVLERQWHSGATTFSGVAKGYSHSKKAHAFAQGRCGQSINRIILAAEI